jgi:phage FluMu protein gp41
MAATGARTEINIARIKSALKLTPEQHASWAAVEGTLVAIAREQAQKISDVSHPISHRVVAIALNTTNMNRIAAVAMPLIRTLSADQKKVAQGLAQQIGLGAYAAFI